MDFIGTETRGTRWLCVCAGGNVRSAAIAFRLKDLGQDAIAVGLLWNSRSTLEVLCQWAERIWIAEPEMLEALPAPARSKVANRDRDYTGPDVWGLGMHPQLAVLSESIAEDLVRYSRVKAG